jgi:uncharacterized membrane protein YhhN
MGGNQSSEKMKSAFIIIFYVILAVFYFLCQSWHSDNAEFILKALIIPVLIVLFLVNIRPSENSLHYLLLAALIFSWAGDILLDIPKKFGDYFIPGLISFLLSHIMYLTLFFRTPGKNVIFSKRSYLLIPVVIYGLGLIEYLYPGLGPMAIPVIVYALAILIMISAAINRLEKVNKTSYYLVLAGAILFLISDTAIAVSRFHHHFHGSSLFIMTTYMAAQLLIVSGYIAGTKAKLS